MLDIRPIIPYELSMKRAIVDAKGSPSEDVSTKKGYYTIATA
jgi:hypothetical protein